MKSFKKYDDRELLCEAWDLLRDLEEKFAEIDKLRSDMEAVIEAAAERV